MFFEGVEGKERGVLDTHLDHTLGSFLGDGDGVGINAAVIETTDIDHLLDNEFEVALEAGEVEGGGGVVAAKGGWPFHCVAAGHEEVGLADARDSPHGDVKHGDTHKAVLVKFEHGNVENGAEASKGPTGKAHLTGKHVLVTPAQATAKDHDAAAILFGLFSFFT